jgi:hypothetical protein
VPNALEMYRRVLAAQPDHSVVVACPRLTQCTHSHTAPALSHCDDGAGLRELQVASVGMLTNLADLLRSGADEHSDLDGADLVSLKVRRQRATAHNAQCAHSEHSPH